MKTLTLFIAAATMMLPCPATAQNAEAEVVATVNKLFQGMRTKDTALIRSLFVPGARLVGAGTRTGAPRIQPTTIDQFIAAVARPGAEWVERMVKPEVRIDGHLATLWAYYDFHLGTTFSHCGVDAVQLARGPDGWKIAAIADTQRTERCVPPPE